MDWKSFAATFGTVFLAELGDKTQLATVLFASNRATSAVAVFVAASLALVTSSAIAVVAGSQVARYVDTRQLSIVAGVGFIAIGAWAIWSALRGA